MSGSLICNLQIAFRHPLYLLTHCPDGHKKHQKNVNRFIFMTILPAQPPSITLILQPGSTAPQIPLTGQLAQEGRQLNLQVNEIIQATVTEGGLNNVELELNRLRFRAFSKIPLTAGQKINLQVVQTQPQIQLKMLNEIDLQYLFKALNFFSEKKGFLPIFSLFLQHQDESTLQNISFSARQRLNQLQEFFYSQADNFLGKSLAGLSRMLGLDFEALIAQGQIEEGSNSLKSILLTLSQNLQENTKEAKNVDNLLKTIEMWQIFQLRLADKGIFFLPLPFPFLEQGYMLAGHSKEENQEVSGQDTSWISIHLRLSALGNIEAILFSKDKGIDIRIMCQSTQIAQYMSKFKNELMDNIESTQISKLTIDIGAKDPEKNLLTHLLPNSDNFLNATV